MSQTFIIAKKLTVHTSHRELGNFINHVINFFHGNQQTVIKQTAHLLYMYIIHILTEW